MTEAERTEAAYLFALKLAREGRLPKPGMKDYREQIEKTRAEFGHNVTKVWDKTRYPVWRERILAVKEGEVVRGDIVVAVIDQGRKLGAISRAWNRACRSLND